MDNLNVRKPRIVTRVSDHIPHIISYISKIMENDFGYEIEGKGIYFDVKKFGNDYGKLAPKGRDFFAAVEDDNGTSSLQGKRSVADFALWKLAKAGETKWASPWGDGRPGWHIECSAMTNSVFGTKLDVHVGGVDLAFPHHCNEIAQCEAFNKHQNWVNTFMVRNNFYKSFLNISFIR
jgi:cysteinyl-tRNA synthetase